MAPKKASKAGASAPGSSKALKKNAETSKKARANYGKTGAVERVLIKVAGPKLFARAQ